jgi:hypothetical protein
MSERDGWTYSRPSQDNLDARRIVTLRQAGMTWIGIRAWNHEKGLWMNNSEPELATVVAWQMLPEPAKGWYDRGKLHIPGATSAAKDGEAK